MKTVLFASAAAVSLALAGAAFAQTAQPVPTPPPVQTPAETPDAAVEGQVGTTVQATPPQAQTDAAASGEAQAQTATPTPPDAAAPPTAKPQGQADAAAAPTVPPAEAADNAAAMAASPASPTAPQAAAAAAPATASSVCEPRVTSVHFGARGAALSQQNRNAIEHAVDAASVCTLQSVVIADIAEGRLSTRRAEAVRATLVRQGVPRDRISVESAANAEGAGAGQLDIRMNFAGVASAEATPAATNEAEPAPTPPAS